MKYILVLLVLIPLVLHAQKPTVKFGAEQTVGCAPFTVNFIDSSSSDVIIWEWDVDNDGTYDYYDPNPIHTYTTPGLYSVRLMVSNLDDSSFLVKQRFIRVVAAPSISLQSNLTLCDGDTALLRPILTGGVRPYKFFWELNGSVPQISVDSQPRFLMTVNSTLRVTVSDSAGCEVIRDLPLNILAKPTLAITANGRALEATAGLSSYQWLKDSVLIQGATARQYVVPENQKGNYSVRARGTNGCTAQSVSVFLDDKTSVAFQQPDGWFVYPLPAADVLTIRANGEQTASIDIISLVGESLLHKDVQGTTMVSLSQLPSGIYLLRISEPNKVQYMKLMKE